MIIINIYSYAEKHQKSQIGLESDRVVVLKGSNKIIKTCQYYLYFILNRHESS